MTSPLNGMHYVIRPGKVLIYTGDRLLCFSLSVCTDLRYSYCEWKMRIKLLNVLEADYSFRYKFKW